MAITELAENVYTFGKVRYFAADRLYNDEPLYRFNKGKIKAQEIVCFDIALMEAGEIAAEEIEKVSENAEQLLAVIVRPGIEPDYVVERKPGFEFCGYDLVELQTGISAITNCGADWEDALDYSQLNKYALLPNYRQAVFTQLELAEKYPDESHAYCEIVEIWRKLVKN